MNESGDGAFPWFLLALLPLIPVGLVAMWLLIGTVLAELSGWPGLARRYRAATAPEGAHLSGQVVSFGWCSERNVTRLVVSAEGLYLRPMILFRFRRPPLLVPWHDLAHESERRILGSRQYALKIGGTTTLWVKERAFQEIGPYLQNPPARSGAA
jgi:hypothetical protein